MKGLEEGNKGWKITAPWWIAGWQIHFMTRKRCNMPVDGFPLVNNARHGWEYTCVWGGERIWTQSCRWTPSCLSHKYQHVTPSSSSMSMCFSLQPSSTFHLVLPIASPSSHTYVSTDVAKKEEEKKYRTPFGPGINDLTTDPSLFVVEGRNCSFLISIPFYSISFINLFFPFFVPHFPLLYLSLLFCWHTL